MFTPIPMFEVEGSSALPGWPRYLLVEAPEKDSWFIARVIVGRDLSGHTMMFSSAEALVNTMHGVEFKKCVSLTLVISKPTLVVTHNVKRLWTPTPECDGREIAELVDGGYVTVCTGERVFPEGKFFPALVIN